MHLTNKNTCAPTPPMGWNSYDYYDTTVTEDAVKARGCGKGKCRLYGKALKSIWLGVYCSGYPVVCKKGRFHARPVSVYSIL